MSDIISHDLPRLGDRLIDRGFSGDMPSLDLSSQSAVEPFGMLGPPVTRQQWSEIWKRVDGIKAELERRHPELL